MSENPQADPRQGFGGPGQAPPPMPGQAPPPVPPQAPGGPSAWSQPVPAGGPGNSAPRGGRSRIWLIGGAAALAVAVVVGVVIATSGDDDKGGTASGKPSGAPGDAAKPKAPSSGKAFTKVPKGCELIKASTIEKIAPGGECTPGLMDDKDLATMITRMPRWEPADYGRYQSLSVSLTVAASAKGQYDLKKRTALSDLNGLRKAEGSRPVSGLGEEALVVSTVDARDGTLAQSEVVVREGNASLSVDFTYSRSTSDTTQKQAEDAAITAARDVLASLS
ncbi:hypothetical protein [Streptomyces sp. NPDC003006]